MYRTTLTIRHGLLLKRETFDMFIFHVSFVNIHNLRLASLCQNLSKIHNAKTYPYPTSVYLFPYLLGAYVLMTDDY